MKFSNNLQILRKEANLSQEQLADKLNVSRQAVSKWESNSSYPEVDKLIAICEIFKCTLDDLVNGNVEKKEINIKDKYDKFNNKMSLIMAFAVGFIILGLSFMLFIEAFVSNDTISNISSFSAVIFFSFVTVSVFCFIYFGMQMEDFNRKYKNIPKIYSDQEMEDFNKKFSLAIASGVTLILFGIIFILISEAGQWYSEDFAAAVFMFLISISVSIFVYFGMQREKFQIDKYNDKIIYNEKYESKSDKLSGIIMMIATIVFLILGFVFNMWHPGWIVFPIGGMICGIISIIYEK
ncbi:MAG: helix-turn-helix domain-containing protein [Bacilli bacterium]|nr:helix-turn-helix domain-containing protein [Bacilli bacterium]